MTGFGVQVSLVCIFTPFQVLSLSFIHLIMYSCDEYLWRNYYVTVDSEDTTGSKTDEVPAVVELAF